MKRFLEFFMDDDRRLSMSRLLSFLSFFPASYVVCINAEGLNVAAILGIYLTAYVAGYVGGKGIDAWAEKNANTDEGK